MHDSRHTEFGQRYAAAWCSGDPARVAEFYSPMGSLAINGGTPSVGRAPIADAARAFMQAFPDIHVRMDKLTETDDRVDFHWTLIGTNTGPGGTGRPVHISGVESWKFGEDGLVLESFGRFDEEEYQRQLHDGL